MKEQLMEKQPYPVFLQKGTIQDGDIHKDWTWVEPSIWNSRMLTTLEKGVKGGKWYSLYDKVCRPNTLLRAFELVSVNKGSAGVDHQTISMYAKHLSANISKLSTSLSTGSYHPQSIKRVMIPKPGGKGSRPLGIPTVQDRIVQTALRMVLEPIFERDFNDHSYGFRPQRGCKDALREVQGLLNEGYLWVLDADLQNYFDTIDHSLLLDLIRQKVTDGKILHLIKLFLSQEIFDGFDRWSPEHGTPQGAVISPLLSNIFLDPLDHLLASRGYRMVRYADDFVVLCQNKDDVACAGELIKTWTLKVKLVLHPEKTRKVLVSHDAGFDFLGYHFRKGNRRPSSKSLKKFKDKIRMKTRRTNGQSLKFIIHDLNMILKGWFEYFKQSNKWIIKRLDQWIRMRLRSILRKRDHRYGIGRGYDHMRWPNAFFSKHGLFSMTSARELACQSVRR